MGRFETTAAFYRFREPYPPEFFAQVAQELHFTPRTRLLDVGCGPGNLVLGFAPFVGLTTAIDIEPDMLRVARESAAQSGINVNFLETKIEDFPDDCGAFDVVTIGRALHWLDAKKTLAVLDRIVERGGCVAVCGSAPSHSPVNAWVEPFKTLRNAWGEKVDEAHYRPDLDSWFAPSWFGPSRFRRLKEIAVTHQHTLSLDHLLSRALSFSVTSPAVLGPSRQQFQAALRTALEPFAHHGMIEEEVVATAIVFAEP